MIMTIYFLYVFYEAHDIYITIKDVYDKWEADVNPYKQNIKHTKS